MDIADTMPQALMRYVPTGVEHIAAAAIETMSEGVVIFDQSRSIRLISRRAMILFGLARTASPPATLGSLLAISPRIAQSAVSRLLDLAEDTVADPSGEPSLAEFGLDGAPGLGFALRRTTPDSWMLRVAERQSDREGERLLSDPLTGLAGRAMFLARCAAMRDRPPAQRVLGAVLSIGLDGLRLVADTLGREVAETLLRAVAEKLTSVIREHDLAARVGDAEFAVLQSETRDEASAEALGRRLTALLDEPVAVGEDLYGLGARVGYALLVMEGHDAEKLLRRASLAASSARPHAMACVRRFEPGMEVAAQSALAIEAALRRAVVEENFTLHYQPLVSLNDRRILGFEALLRWNDKVHGNVSPAFFVPVAERVGLMSRLGGWILRTACLEAASWPGALSVAVNIAPTQFDDGDLIQDVLTALDQSKLDPGRLELEITESVVVAPGATMIGQITELRARGIRIAMDDFGTGYSSLARLSTLPLDRLKIDRTFVHQLTAGSQAEAIARAVAELGQRLGLAITAEGVETEAQRDILCALGCMDAQGLLFGRPTPAEDLRAAIARLSH